MTTTPSSVLTILQGGQDQDLQELQITKDGLREFATEFLRGEGVPDDVISVAELLEKPAFAGLLDTCEKSYHLHVRQVNEERAKERRKREADKQRLQAATAKELDAKLRERFGLPKVLTQEEIRAKAMANHIEVTTGVKQNQKQNDQPNSYVVPGSVLALREKFGHKLPEFVFESSNQAIMFREVLKLCIKPLRAKLKEGGLDAGYESAVRALYYPIQNHLFPLADAVITEGWGLDLQSSISPLNLYQEIWNEVEKILIKDKRFITMMTWVGRCPTPEDLQTQTKAKGGQQTEANAKDEAETIRRNELKDILKARLAEVDGGPKEKHDLQARSLVKHYGNLPDIKAIFMARAVFQMTPKDSKQPEEHSARFYAQCADVPFEEILAIVALNAGPKKPGGKVKARAEPSPKPAPDSGGKPSNAQRRVARATRDEADRKAAKSPKGSSGFRGA